MNIISHVVPHLVTPLGAPWCWKNKPTSSKSSNICPENDPNVSTSGKKIPSIYMISTWYNSSYQSYLHWFFPASIEALKSSCLPPSRRRRTKPFVQRRPSRIRRWRKCAMARFVSPLGLRPSIEKKGTIDWSILKKCDHMWSINVVW